MRIKVLTNKMEELEKFLGKGINCKDVPIGGWTEFVDDNYNTWQFDEFMVDCEDMSLWLTDYSEEFELCHLKVLFELYDNHLIIIE